MFDDGRRIRQHVRTDVLPHAVVQREQGIADLQLLPMHLPLLCVEAAQDVFQFAITDFIRRYFVCLLDVPSDSRRKLLLDFILRILRETLYSLPGGLAFFAGGVNNGLFRLRLSIAAATCRWNSP